MKLLYILLPMMGTLPYVLSQKPYDPVYHFAILNRNPNFRVTASKTERLTNIFVPFRNDDAFENVFVTTDFVDYLLDNPRVEHLLKRNVRAGFAVYDRNTSGCGNRHLLGYLNQKKGVIIHLESDTRSSVSCCENCVNANLSGTVVAAWDWKNKWWVSLAQRDSAQKVFVVSTDLKNWTPKTWLLTTAPEALNNAVELIPMEDANVPGTLEWFLVERTPEKRLTYATFVTDDADQKYRVVGVLDHSVEWAEYALITDNSDNYKTRRVVSVMRGQYTNYPPIYYNTYVSARTLRYSGGILRQEPVVNPAVTFQKTYDPFLLEAGMGLLSCLPPSRSFTVEAEFSSATGGYGFRFFVDPEDSNRFGASIAITSNTVVLRRSNWLPENATAKTTEYPLLSVPYKAVGGSLKILVLVDICIVEVFVNGGESCGSIFTFPNTTWNEYEVVADSQVRVTGLHVKLFDEPA